MTTTAALPEVLKTWRTSSWVAPDPATALPVVQAGNLLIFGGLVLLFLAWFAWLVGGSRRTVRRTQGGLLLATTFLGGLGAYLIARSRLIYQVEYWDYVDERRWLVKGSLARSMKIEGALLDSGFTDLVQWFAAAALLVGAILVVTALVGLLWRRRWTLSGLRVACWSFYLLLGAYGYLLWRGAGIALQYEILGGPKEIDRAIVGKLVFAQLWPCLWLLAGVVFLHVQFWRRWCLDAFGIARPPPGAAPAIPAWRTAVAPGDALVENLRTHGADPQYRKSLFSSMLLHLLVLVIIPALGGLFGCVRDYRVPKGIGNPVVALVATVKPQRKKVQKYILNPWSAIILHPPDVDDSRILNEVDDATQLPYTANTLAARRGKTGVGGEGNGGWPDGMDKSEVRFIRLSYEGRGWDDGMPAYQRADTNFLERFFIRTGFKIAKAGEAHAVSVLKQYRQGYAPPFVYLTGNAGIRLSRDEELMLRDYCLDGGLLFADCGGAPWHGSFLALMQRVFPDKPLVRIPDDDPIFRQPFGFPSGAPPLWHHGGTGALGVKYQDRWCVFYHPGDVNDAWKTGGSGLKPEQIEEAYDLGFNIVHYAFTNYLEATRKYRQGTK